MSERSIWIEVRLDLDGRAKVAQYGTTTGLRISHSLSHSPRLSPVSLSTSSATCVDWDGSGSGCDGGAGGEGGQPRESAWSRIKAKVDIFGATSA